eukprot:TRINITY_DN1472_c1_g1_i5.p1 TRINITY_DN1472_c1_g1~~TRINITY_DN1472_c1_g1_i5.p1  ORF type:complete len:781 (+),score=111.15 TRINITY_DN1472_c1_g1_i5:149-2344(+)
MFFFSAQTLASSSTLIKFSISNPSIVPHRTTSSPIPRALSFQSQPKIDESSQIPIRTNVESPSKNEQSPPDDGFGPPDENALDEQKRISGIHVPRQRYIPVSKADLLKGILSMFESQESVDEFLRVSMCLDSIIHAEHKVILEEMRIDYSLTQLPESKCNITSHPTTASEEVVGSNQQPLSQEESLGSEDMEQNMPEKEENDKSLPFHYGLDLTFLLGLNFRNSKRNSAGGSRVAAAARFQRTFLKLLRDAQFEELSAQDLLLTSALNTDYILTLPIYVDWKKASESNAIIFRRGYGTERQKGLLIVEKLDYLQSRLLQGIFFIISRPIKNIGMWINEALKSTSQFQEMENWLERARRWLKELDMPLETRFHIESSLDDQPVADQLSDSDLPIWLAAQRAVPRYEGLLSSVLGPRGRLLRKLLIWTGFIPSMQETSFDIDNASKVSEPYLRPNCLSRISLSDIWEPATREACGNNLWKMFKNAISILFTKSILQEPDFEELILLYTEENGDRETMEKDEVPSLQLKIYERIPIPDLPVVFPHKKLSFRILDTVRLDVASIVGLSAFFVNYKFEDIVSSPSAVLLDVIAVSALIIYVTRVALGYKQTWDRYQLLVNKTLYEKTLASGFGSVHFLLDASEQQQYKEAVLAYAIILLAEKHEAACTNSIRDICERFMYDKFMEKVEMPIGKALETLLRLGLVKEVSLEGNFRLQALPCSKAYEALKERWDTFLE